MTETTDFLAYSDTVRRLMVTACDIFQDFQMTILTTTKKDMVTVKQ